MSTINPRTDWYGHITERCNALGVSLRAVCNKSGVSYPKVIQWKGETPRMIRDMYAVEDKLSELEQRINEAREARQMKP